MLSIYLLFSHLFYVFMLSCLHEMCTTGMQVSVEGRKHQIPKPGELLMV